jgi:hypothetical protein
MIHRTACLFLLAAVLGAAAQAQLAFDPAPPSRAQVLQLMIAMGVKQRVEASLKAAQAKVKDNARVAFLKSYPDAAPEALKKLDAVFDATPLFSFDDISDPMVAVYQQNLSAVDVQACIDFYNTDAGKHLLEKTPVIQRETSTGAGALVQQKLGDYSQDIERRLAELREQMGPPRPVATKAPAAKPEEKK